MIARKAYWLLLAALFLIFPSSAFAQTYAFTVDRTVVHLFINPDGTTAIDYVFTFTNAEYASPIEFVDIGMPNGGFDWSSIKADVDGKPVAGVEESPYVTHGFAINLGAHAIQPGETADVHVLVGKVQNVIYRDSEDNGYASLRFSPTWFGEEFVQGQTDLSLTVHFPPGLTTQEPRYHAAPSGWQDVPVFDFDGEGRITYTWHNPAANAFEQYNFGVSFPQKYIPAETIVKPDPFAWLRQISVDALLPFLCIGGFALFFVGSYISNKKRKMQYLPPKMAIEGHGIKRGLTAVEAAVVMEQPLDKILTMILFAVIKKNAAQVVTREPLKLTRLTTQTTGLHPYELDFLAAFDEPAGVKRQRALQDMTINLIKAVGLKMKGFSRRDTLAYYKNITERAWQQVEAANTPEVKSEKYNEVMEWTMLDRNYDDRTRDVFRHGPFFLPNWWGRYQPGPVISSGGGSLPTSSGGPGGAFSMPHLPGSDFAASMVNSVQNFAGGVIGNLTDFTSRVTNATNPVPQSTSSSGSSGRSGGCACACACAGCACACAGGGR